MDIATRLQMNNGREIPALGLGVYQTPAGDATQQIVLDSFAAGYRHIDTARFYRNEADVGAAVRSSGIPREEIFVTTKLWESEQGYDSAIAACLESLDLMGLEYVDLYLIHWPRSRHRADSWRALEALYDDGRCLSIGVSNYMVHHVEELLGHARIAPAVNQIEMTPYLYGSRHDILTLCELNAIVVEAYSPLTRGHKLKDPRLVEIASHYDKTTAQILIRWSLEKGFVVLPKSSKKQRIIENADVFDFAISAEDMAALDALDETLITSSDANLIP